MPIASGFRLGEEILVLDMLGTIMGAGVEPSAAVQMMAANHPRSVFHHAFVVMAEKMSADKSLSLGQAMATQNHAFSSFVPGLVAATECLNEPESGLLLAAELLEEFRPRQEGIEEADFLVVVDLNLLAHLIEGEQTISGAVEKVSINTVSSLKLFWGAVLQRMGGGEPLSRAMEGDEQTRMFKPWVTQLVRLGEQARTVDVMLAKVARYFFDQLVVSS